LIFTEKTFRSLQKEITVLRPARRWPAKAIVKSVAQPETDPLPKRIIHDYEPSHVWSAYDGRRQRWRRVNEWFAQFTRDERESEYAKIAAKPLNQ